MYVGITWPDPFPPQAKRLRMAPTSELSLAPSDLFFFQGLDGAAEAEETVKSYKDVSLLCCRRALKGANENLADESHKLGKDELAALVMDLSNELCLIEFERVTAGGGGADDRADALHSVPQRVLPPELLEKTPCIDPSATHHVGRQVGLVPWSSVMDSAVELAKILMHYGNTAVKRTGATAGGTLAGVGAASPHQQLEGAMVDGTSARKVDKQSSSLFVEMDDTTATLGSPQNSVTAAAAGNSGGGGAFMNATDRKLFSDFFSGTDGVAGTESASPQRLLASRFTSKQLLPPHLGHGISAPLQAEVPTVTTDADVKASVVSEEKLALANELLRDGCQLPGMSNLLCSACLGLPDPSKVVYSKCCGALFCDEHCALVPESRLCQSCASGPLAVGETLPHAVARGKQLAAVIKELLTINAQTRCRTSVVVGLGVVDTKGSTSAAGGAIRSSTEGATLDVGGRSESVLGVAPPTPTASSVLGHSPHQVHASPLRTSSGLGAEALTPMASVVVGGSPMGSAGGSLLPLPPTGAAGSSRKTDSSPLLDDVNVPSSAKKRRQF